MKQFIIGLLIIPSLAWADFQLSVNGKPVTDVKCSIQTGKMPPEQFDCQDLPPMGPDDRLIIQAIEPVDVVKVINDLQVIAKQK